MKIAVVFDGLQVGGIEKVGIDYCKILLDLNHEVTVINLNPQKKELQNEFPKQCDFIFYKLKKEQCPESYSLLLKNGYLGIIKYLFKSILCSLLVFIKRNIFYLSHKKKKYDLVISFSGHINDLNFVSKDFLNTKFKMAWLHGALYSYLLSSSMYGLLYNRIKNINVLVDDGQEEALMYNSWLDLKINKIYNPTTISNKGLDLLYIKQLKNRYRDFILMVARLDYPHKDHYTVIDSAYLLFKSYGVKRHFVFVGDGPERKNLISYLNNFEKEFKEYIHFEGNVTNVQNYYSAASILVHSSVAGEGLPTVLLEALSFNLPIVSTDSKVGPREILDNDRYGLLCKVKNPKEMANKIYSLITNENLYRQYQKLSKDRIKNFSYETIKNELDSILKSL